MYLDACVSSNNKYCNDGSSGDDGGAPEQIELSIQNKTTTTIEGCGARYSTGLNEPHELENLISLCLFHHIHLDGHREFWTGYFRWILNFAL